MQISKKGMLGHFPGGVSQYTVGFLASWDPLPRDGARAPSITSRNCLPRISSCPAPEKIRGRLNHEIPNDDLSPIIEWFVFIFYHRVCFI